MRKSKKMKKIRYFCLPKDLPPGRYKATLSITEKTRSITVFIKSTEEDTEEMTQNNMKEIKPKYYACLELKDGAVIKKAFTHRANARKYIEKHFNPEIHTQCWTE